MCESRAGKTLKQKNVRYTMDIVLYGCWNDYFVFATCVIAWLKGVRRTRLYMTKYEPP